MSSFICVNPTASCCHAMIDPSEERITKEIHWLDRALDSARHPKKGREVSFLDQIKAAHSRAEREGEEDGGKYSRRLHIMLANAPKIDDLDEWIWKLLLP